MNVLFQMDTIEQSDLITMDEYIQNQKDKFLRTFDCDKIMWNENIHIDLYDKEKSIELINDVNNSEEPLWKSRILFDAAVREDGKLVSVIMFYDFYKQGFGYYSNDNLSYQILNAVAMKYVVTFFCRDFFIDDNVFEDIEYSTQLQMLKNAPVTKQDPSVVKKSVFAKFKNYQQNKSEDTKEYLKNCLLYTSPSPRDGLLSRMPSSA